MNWTTHYPGFVNDRQERTMAREVEIADIGCGFGGLLVALAPVFPETLMLGS